MFWIFAPIVAAAAGSIVLGSLSQHEHKKQKKQRKKQRKAAERAARELSAARAAEDARRNTALHEAAMNPNLCYEARARLSNLKR